MLGNAFDRLLIDDTHTMPLNDLMRLSGYDSGNLQHLKESIKAMATTGIEWNITGTDYDEWGVAALLAGCQIINGVVHYGFYKPFVEKLANPKTYAKISIVTQSRLKKRASLALYELCLDYYSFKHQRGESPWLSLDTFRKLMGVDKKKYDTYKALSQFVIKPSINEVSKQTPLKIELQVKRQGRKIAFLKLVIRLNHAFKRPDIEPKALNDPQASLPLLEFQIDNQELYYTLTTKYHLDNKTAIDLLTNYDEFHILEKIELTELYIEKNQIKGSIGGFLLNAVRKNWKNKTVDARFAKVKAAKKAQDKERLEQIENARTRIDNAKTDQAISELSKSEQADLEKQAADNLNDFIKRFKNQPDSDIYTDGLLANMRKLYKQWKVENKV